MVNFRAANTAITALAQQVDAASTQIVVLDASIFPEPPFVIRVDDEIMKVTAVNENTFTVERAFENTTAQPHSQGAQVKNVWTAEMYETVRSAIIANENALSSHSDSTQDTHGISTPYYIAKTSRSDQLPDWSDIQNKPSPTITLEGDVSGSATLSEVGDATINVTVVNDSHTHSDSTITSVDWSKILNKPSPTITLSGDVSGSGTMTDMGDVTINVVVDQAANADKLDNLDSSQFLRSDTDDTMTGLLTLHKSGEVLRIGGDSILNSNDAWIYFGNADYAWRIKYVSSTSGNGGNELRLESTSTGKYLQIDHDGNIEYYDGSAIQKIWHSGNDGSGSGLDADKLDGKHASDFQLQGHNHDSTYVNVTGDTMTGDLTAPNFTATNAVNIGNFQLFYNTTEESLDFVFVG